MKAIIVRPGTLARKFDSLRGEFREVAEREVEAAARTIYGDSQAAVPVLTEELKLSGFHEAEGLRSSVQYSAEHARPVEFGTGDTPAQPFLFPAAERERRRLVRRVQRQMRAAAKRVAGQT